MADATAPVGLNPFEPGFFADPYVQYGAIREAEPAHRTPFGPWMLTRWADVHQLLRAPGTSVEDRNSTGAFDRRAAFAEVVGERAERGNRAILNIDPPDHTRIRRLVSKAFTPRTVEQLAPRITEIVDERLDAAAEHGKEPFDVISGLAFPLPFQVISEMLGMPPGDTDQLRDWSHTLTQILDPVLAMLHAEAIFEASDRMIEVVTDAIAWKRGRPDDDDLLTALIRAEDGGDVLSQEELVDNVILLFLAGHETTVNLIGNGTNALVRHPDQMARLVADPDSEADAVEELLRFDSPVQFSRRILLSPIDIAGVRMEAGDFVMTCLGAANRDPRKFGDDAATLHLDRPDANQHVSFGSGVHHCLGAALARIEGRIAIGRLVRRFPHMAPTADEPAWNGRLILRGLDRLPVHLHG